MSREQVYRLLLENMRGQMPRTARFVSAITCCFPNGDVLTARGECPGTIAYAPMGESGFFALFCSITMLLFNLIQAECGTFYLGLGKAARRTML